MKTVTFGQYPQVDNQVLPLEWYVIEENRNEMWLLSK